jgi:hypothetical protein
MSSFPAAPLLLVGRRQRHNPPVLASALMSCLKPRQFVWCLSKGIVHVFGSDVTERPAHRASLARTFQVFVKGFIEDSMCRHSSYPFQIALPESLYPPDKTIFDDLYRLDRLCAPDPNVAS